MKTKKLTRWLALAMMLVCVMFLLVLGCSYPSKVVLPNLGSEASPNINPEPRPVPPLFTETEFNSMTLTAKGKIAKNQVDHRAYADIMETKIKILKDYIDDLLGDKKTQ